MSRQAVNSIKYIFDIKIIPLKYEKIRLNTQIYVTVHAILFPALEALTVANQHFHV